MDKCRTDWCREREAVKGFSWHKGDKLLRCQTSIGHKYRVWTESRKLALTGMGVEGGSDSSPLFSLTGLSRSQCQEYKSCKFLSYRYEKVVLLLPFCSSYTLSSAWMLFFMTRGFSGKYLWKGSSSIRTWIQDCFFYSVAFCIFFFFFSSPRKHYCASWSWPFLLCYHVGQKSQVLPLWRILFYFHG